MQVVLHMRSLCHSSARYSSSRLLPSYNLKPAKLMYSKQVKQGLYDPQYEKEGCGVGFIVAIDGCRSHKIIRDAQRLTMAMDHRGASSKNTGDGAGVLTAIPHSFYHETLKSEQNVQLPEFGKYATGIFFLDKTHHEESEKKFSALAEELGMSVLAWRTVPTNNSVIGEVAKNAEPFMSQAFVTVKKSVKEDELDRLFFILRKRASHALPAPGKRFYICSLSRKIVVYKGQFTCDQLWTYFPDLLDPAYDTYLALVHTRFSTNTFPSWEKAHPLRHSYEVYEIPALPAPALLYIPGDIESVVGTENCVIYWNYSFSTLSNKPKVGLLVHHIKSAGDDRDKHHLEGRAKYRVLHFELHRILAHNGEINTLRGNVNYMKAREGIMENEDFGDQLKKLYPVVEPNLSDSGSADCVLEFLVHAGNRSLPEAVMTMVPEAWQNDLTMEQERRDFYKWAACTMEPWDGPALITFTDGRYIGAVLDRNGLRPARCCITKDNVMVMASEVGVYDAAPADIVYKYRLRPGRMVLVDTEGKSYIRDIELKLQIAKSRPHSEWLKEQLTMEKLRKAHVQAGHPAKAKYEPSGLDDKRLSLYAYTTETIHMLLVPMITNKKESLGSMGNDAPLACLSNFSPLLYDYFKQLFAQVTNPPIDPFREKIVMSLQCPIGPEDNILKPSVKAHRLWLKHPILSIDDMEVLKNISYYQWKSHIIDITFPACEGIPGFVKKLDSIREEAEEARKCNQILILSDRLGGKDRVPVSSLLALGAIHHYLIEKRSRVNVALVVETAEAREVHHMCLLLGYGADAICPYLALELSSSLREDEIVDKSMTNEVIFRNYALAMEIGISKVMAKMGISTLQSYKGAQIFEAVGLAEDVINKAFQGTPSRVGGVTLEMLASEAFDRHRHGYEDAPDARILRNPGFYFWRVGGEKHINEPLNIAALQEAAINKNKEAYEVFRNGNMKSVRQCTLRGRLDFCTLDEPLPLCEIEPASEIVKRFVTGAMSFGSLNLETHTALAIAMNTVGGKSNTGEGGEDEERYLDKKRRSAIKQVASGRFGVTSSYLAHADELQIKMAQGAKPGEGGELPGRKVSADIAKTRHSVTGVGLISPPPHHDIYSIEDLAELIYDLKCTNPNVRISVKLVSEIGVGIVASGVVKGKAEKIVISGHDGGTGASSWTGIKHAGLPWELGVAETHQVLVLNDLRSKVVIQGDGHIRTGFDVVVAGLLGVDEIGISTAPLIVYGCIMMRKCQTNTCPVGLTTQDPFLRKKFTGKPEHLINYMFMLAEEVRQHMAKLGVRTFQELIGRTDLLKVIDDGSEKAKRLNLDSILQNALEMRPGVNIRGGSEKQVFHLERRLENQLIEKAKPVIDGDQKCLDIEMKIHNADRAFGSTLSYHISCKYNEDGLPDGSQISVKLTGSAGQSFASFIVKGITLTLEGEANDYVGKGLSGGTVIIYPPKVSRFMSHENVIVGNVCLYGAIQGRAYIRGIAAERFAVRNSGAVAVVEGVGDHGCEYMTGGIILITGLTGRNFAAGMSGGIAYVWDVDGQFSTRCNKEMVELCELEEKSDVDQVRQLLQEFHELTGSLVAKQILDDFDSTQKQFIKVFPYEYQKTLKREAVKVAIQTQLEDHETDVQEIEDLTDVPSTETKSEPGAEMVEEEAHGEPLDKLRGFMKYKRDSKPYRPVEERLQDWDEVYNFCHVRKGLRVQTARCMDCGTPFCHSTYGCPLGNIIPKWNLLVFEKQWKRALNHLLQTNNFPEFTGRVCPAPCEGACVLGISEPSVTIKNIECAIIDNAFENGWIVPQIPAVRTEKRVAVVGSGPSGLACAAQLNKAGHLVTVFERNDRLGGLLQYGIPTMKISKAVVQRRVDLLTAEGIIFKTNFNVSEDISAEELSKEYDAVVLTTGATVPRDLPLPGRELAGIHFAMEFLEKWQKKQLGAKIEGPHAKDKNVIVIGSGDTGCDCIATSLRQGAADIIALEILPKPPLKRATDNPWPQPPKIFKSNYGHEEVKLVKGCDPRVFSIMTQKFLDDGKGHVGGIKTVDVEWTKNAAGRWQMKPIPYSEKEFKADLVFLAMGFLGPECAVADQLKLKLDSKSNFDTKNFKTNVTNVFAAGDCRRGQSLVVTAIAEGRQAARAVDEFLKGCRSFLPGPGGII